MAIVKMKKLRLMAVRSSKEALLRELGDVAWYLAETAWALDATLEEVCQGNIDKLRRRYPEGFSREKSLHREAE